VPKVFYLMTTNIAELKRHADIRGVWFALGGGELRHGRGQAFWRNGDSHSIALDLKKNVWFDHVAGVGGDVVALVRTVQQCGFTAAAKWLGEFTGITAAEGTAGITTYMGTDWETDFRAATSWKLTAEALAEWALETLPYYDPERRELTQLLRTIRLGDSALVHEYREWRTRHPRLTAGMVHAGRLHDARIQRRLAHWIRRYLDGPHAA
jgi:hypothetical protein